MEKWWSRDLSSEKCSEIAPSTTSESALLLISNVVVFIIDLHAKNEKLIPKPSSIFV